MANKQVTINEMIYNTLRTKNTKVPKYYDVLTALGPNSAQILNGVHLVIGRLKLKREIESIFPRVMITTLVFMLLLIMLEVIIKRSIMQT